MKYFSEVLEEMFDSEADLHQAEKVYHNQIQELKNDIDVVTELNDNGVEVPVVEVQGKSVDLNALSRYKKELAKEVEAAEAAVEEAYADYAEAQEKCKKILEESNDQMVALLNPAKAAIEEAERNRLAAVRKFNKEFGPFKTTYTGDRAVKEFYRAMNQIHCSFDRLFRF